MIAPKKGTPKLSSLLKVTADFLHVPLTMEHSMELIQRKDKEQHLIARSGLEQCTQT